MAKRTNPNGANQYLADPRQSLFFNYYFNPKEETFGNGLQSALKAGFERTYAVALVSKMPTWLEEKVKELNVQGMLRKAERNLDEMLDLPNKVQAMGAFGPIFEGKGKEKKPIMVHATSLLKVKADVSKFVAERTGRNKWGEEKEPNVNIVQINITEPLRKVYGQRQIDGASA